MIPRFAKLVAGFVVAATVLSMLVVWTTCRIYVPEDACAVLIRKMGDTLPAGQIVAMQPGQRGIQAEVLGPGRYFRDPFRYDWEFKKLTVIPAGNPGTWEWVHSLTSRHHSNILENKALLKGDFPMLGVVTRRVGQEAPPGQTLVKRNSPYKGILEEVLTPGTYKLNPYIYDVELHPAVVIPAGFVGVVTNLFGGQQASTMSAVLSELSGETAPATMTQPSASELASMVRPLAGTGERGTQRDVLQAGVYFINPKLQKVTLVEIGFNELTQTGQEKGEDVRISFPSETGYLIHVGVTVIWGVDPRHAAEVINEFGNVDSVLDKVIRPQLRSICRNIGSTYAARDFIQGEKREQFQHNLTAELRRICKAKNIEVLLALVREIEVHAPQGAAAGGGDVTEDLKRTIQQSYIAKESQITKGKQREAATVKAQLEEGRKKVDIARETIKADTRVMTAGIRAEGEKQAAQVDAEAALEVASIQQQVAELDARRTEILGQAKADVEKLKKGADAEGQKLLVEAFGSPQAYNLYTFAENFQPQSIKLIFAGEGTFWTDLSRFEDVGAAKILSPPVKTK